MRGANRAGCVTTSLTQHRILDHLVGAAPPRKRVVEFFPLFDVHGGLARHQAGIKARPERLFLPAGADKDDLLPAVAVDVAPVLLQRLPPRRIVRPALGRHICPPETQAFGANDGSGLAQFAKPLRACGDPEMTFGPDDAGPRLAQELMKLGRIERAARAVNEVLHAVFLGLRYMVGEAVELLEP